MLSLFWWVWHSSRSVCWVHSFGLLGRLQSYTLLSTDSSVFAVATLHSVIAVVAREVVRAAVCCPLLSLVLATRCHLSRQLFQNHMVLLMCVCQASAFRPLAFASCSVLQQLFRYQFGFVSSHASGRQTVGRGAMVCAQCRFT